MEFNGEGGTGKEGFTDLIVPFYIKDRLDGKNRLAAFVCEDESCFERVRDID